jgi:hypothetical protein
MSLRELSTGCIHTVYTPHVQCDACPSVTHSQGSGRPGPNHGYDLKRTFDQEFGHDRSLRYAQVHAAMSRLLKNGLVEVDGTEAGSGPERKRYANMKAGIADMERLSSTPRTIPAADAP